MDKKKKWWVPHLLTFLGLVMCILPVVIAICELFPGFIGNQKKLVSGIALILMIIAAFPLIKWGRKLPIFRTPSVWVVWLVVLLLFKPLAEIADAVATVATVGLISGLVGQLLFNLAKKYKGDDAIEKLKDALKE